MLFSDHPRTHYRNAPAHEVICQLRFPTILTINNTEPADFQEAVREDFPQYARRQDQLPPRVVNGKPEPQAPVTNYHFLSQDGRWKLNLTRDFIALSTLSYPGWEEFARMLDKPLATFIQLYKPAYFQRELFTPPYLGVLAELDVDEERVPVAGLDVQLKLDSSSAAKIHAGTAHLKNNTPNAPQDPEVKFILDMDLSMSGNTPCGLAAPALETLHGHSTRIFEGAVTDTLRQAMGRV